MQKILRKATPKPNWLFGIVLALFLFQPILQAQDRKKLQFGERFILGSSVTFIYNQEDPFASGYKEYTWNSNVAVNVTPSLYVGVAYLKIHTSGSSYFSREEKANYDLYGVFTQYDFLPKMKNRLFLELSWSKGDFCTCGNGLVDSSRRENLDYVGYGIGYDFPLGNYVSLDLAFMNYDILGEGIQSYFTQYVLGLNLDLSRRKQKEHRL